VACRLLGLSWETQIMQKSQRVRGRERLKGKRIAILVTDGFEQSELEDPRDAFAAEGAETLVVAPHAGEIQGVEHGKRGRKVAVDRILGETRAEDYDALLLPGGVANPDRLRMIPEAVEFVRYFMSHDRPVAAICHGLWTLVEADAVRGRTLTSWPSLQTDLKNAGANWVDREAVVDRKLISARKPDDLPAFIEQATEIISAEQPALHATG
jgi:protease I